MLTFTYDAHTLQASGEYHDVAVPLMYRQIPLDLSQDDNVASGTQEIVAACVMARIANVHYITVPDGWRKITQPENDHAQDEAPRSEQERLVDLVLFLNGWAAVSEAQTVPLGALYDNPRDEDWTLRQEIAELRKAIKV